MRLRFPAPPVTFLVLVSITLAGCGKNPERLFERAKELAAQGDRAGAIIELKSAIQDAPSNASMRFLLGRLYNEKFDGASAEKELIKARALGAPDDGQLSVELARALRQQGKFAELLKKVPAVDTFDHRQLGSVYALRGRAQHVLQLNEDAVKSLGQAIKLDATNPDAAILDSQIKADRQDFSGALKVIDGVLAISPKFYDAWAYKAELLRFLGRLDDALAAYTEVLKINPTDFRALLTRPTLLIRKSRLDEAQKDVDLLVRVYNGHPLAFVQQGVLRLVKGDPQGALESAERALKNAPRLGEANMLAGAAKYAMKAFVPAEHYLSTGLAAKPQDAMTRRLLASTFLELGQPRRALEVIGPGVTADNKDSRNFIIAGDAQLRLGDADQAAAYFDRAAALAPNDTTPKIKGALIKIGIGDEDVGLEQLESALDRNRTPSSADELLILTYLRRKEVDRAAQILALLKKTHSDNAILNNLQGVVLMAQNKQVDAVKVWQATLADHPTFFPAASNLAEIDLLANKPDDARQRFSSILAVDSKNLQAMLAIADLERSLGREKAEQAILEKAAEAQPGAFVPRRRLVPIYLRTGAKDRAMSVMDEALAADPSNPEVIVLAAQTQFTTGNTNRAIDTVKELLRLAPKSEEAHLLLARFQEAAGQAEEAEQTLRAVLAFSPRHSETQIALVSLLQGQKKTAAALQFAQSIQSTQAKSPIGFLLEGEIHQENGKMSDALRAYYAALERQDVGEIAVKIYGAEAQAGDRAGAFARLTKWLDAHPDDPVARATVADVLLSQGDYKGAATHLERVMKIPQVPSMVRNSLAWAYYKLNDPRALETAEGAYKATPDSALITDTLGWILVEKGDVKRGLPLLQRAAALEPENPEISYHLAVALAKFGDRDAAREKLTKILAKGKAFAEAKDAQALLTSLK